MKIVKRVGLVILSIIVILFIALAIYARNPYQPLEAMNTAIDELDTSTVSIESESRYISYTVDNPSKHILFMPGGLVNPESYSYLAMNLAVEGYNVTIFKPFFDLAILTPNYARRFIDPELDNIIIGHSLGGVVASMIARKEASISTVILMGSYPIQDISNKDTLFITAEYDIAMDQEAFDDSIQYVNEDAEFYNIIGGNHAQFGWYGPQKGDGDADITTLEQQTIILATIQNFISE